MGEVPTQEACEPGGGPTALGRALAGRAWIPFLFGAALLACHVFVPTREFIHRGDDAYYYFQVALNYAKLGFWTFDGIHPSNGVQPLWGFFLSGSAVLFHRLGIEDLDVLARLFVAETALLHFGGCLVLYLLLRRYVSIGVGLAAAGAFLFPLGIVWTRVWGMENSLYGLLLASSVLYFHNVVRERGSPRNAIWLGVLLGLTILCRLNSGFFLICLLLVHLFKRNEQTLRQRFTTCVVVGAVASLLVVPVLTYFYVQTGHILPVAGGAKAIRAKLFLSEKGVDSVFSLAFVRAMTDFAWSSFRWWVTSRSLDGTWVLGGRLLHTTGSHFHTLGLVILGLLLAPVLTGRPREWFRYLAQQYARLGPLGYVAVFALINATISVCGFPFEATYSIVRWWLLEGEIVVTVLVATLAASSLGFLAAHFLREGPRRVLGTAGLAVLSVAHLIQMVSFYFDDETQYKDWNTSTNEERYAAAIWIRDNLPEDAIIGCWNAGIIGYYSERAVVNLDGLINSWDFLPYLESGDLTTYLEKENIGYLADTNFELRYRGGAVFRGALTTTVEYRQYMDPLGTGLKYKDQYFYVYRIEEILERNPAIRPRTGT